MKSLGEGLEDLTAFFIILQRHVLYPWILSDVPSEKSALLTVLKRKQKRDFFYKLKSRAMIFNMCIASIFKTCNT